jgi:catechol 2,3-dioxygenase-like lactoylglutathione lyase family enzyme
MNLFVLDTLNIITSNVTVIVSDMDRAVRFYTEILGLTLINRSDVSGNDFAVIQAPGLTIGLNPPQRGRQPGKCDSLSIGFQVDNIENAMTELKSKGIVFSPPQIIVEGPVKLANFTDEDKNPLYLVAVENK